MKQKEITINSKQYPVVFDLGTMINYESIVKHSFFLTDWTKPKITERMAIIYAAALSADENTKLTFDDLKGKGTWDDVKAIFTASNIIITLSGEFFPIPEIEQQAEVDAPADNTEGGTEKN